ncbi:MAG: stringent starvation protein [Gammaproteobacteria bacterium]|jgi:stringent starvation protein B|nr:stringent starvation protein [Gammaproteobacteria bacterium]
MKTSTKPYFIRAIYDWILDNGCTPYIIVSTLHSEVDVPKQYIENDRIVLNLSLHAVNNLRLTNEFISFEAGFSGVLRKIYAPIESIMAIYAQENGQGMIFAEEPELPNSIEENSTVAPLLNDKPELKLVKGSTVVPLSKHKKDKSHLKLIRTDEPFSPTDDK